MSTQSFHWSSRLFWQFLVAFGLPNMVLAVTLVILESRGGFARTGSPESRWVLWLAFLWGVVIFPLSVLSVRRVLRVISQVQNSARKMERGDFSQRVYVLGADELGGLASAFNSMREEIARRLAELQGDRDHMLTVLSGMVEGVLAVDPQLRVLLANDACRNMLGIATREIVGRPLLEVVRNLDVQETMLAALRQGESSSRELPVMGISRRVMRVIATRLPGTPSPGVVMVLHDVTELRQLENLRREFVANVSHELKTPLASISAYAETLRMGALQDEENNIKFVERIEEQASRLNKLILDLLHLARVETGTEAFDLAAVSVREICKVCVTQHGEVASAAGVMLGIEDQDQDAVVWADPDGVRMIADNLVTNAIKFTPAGGSVTLRWKREPEFAIFEVQDTGIGIDLQHQDRVFERFYRVDKARSRELGGTGLGLAIVKHLAQAFGGKVGLTSQVGQGSTFRVQLPLASPNRTSAANRALSRP